MFSIGCNFYTMSNFSNLCALAKKLDPPPPPNAATAAAFSGGPPPSPSASRFQTEFIDYDIVLFSMFSLANYVSNAADINLVY